MSVWLIEDQIVKNGRAWLFSFWTHQNLISPMLERKLEGEDVCNK